MGLASGGESMVVTVRLVGSSHVGVVSRLGGVVRALDGVAVGVVRVGGVRVGSSSASVRIRCDLVLVACDGMARFLVDVTVSEAT